MNTATTASTCPCCGSAEALLPSPQYTACRLCGHRWRMPVEQAGYYDSLRLFVRLRAHAERPLVICSIRAAMDIRQHLANLGIAAQRLIDLDSIYENA